MASVLALFDFATKLLHHVRVLLGFCRIIKMHCLPLRQLKRNRLFAVGMFMIRPCMVVAFMPRLNLLCLASRLGLSLCQRDIGSHAKGDNRHRN